MSISGTIRRAVVMGMTVLVVGAGVAAEASADPVGAHMPCGYIDPGMYRHCDGGSGSTVMLDVQDIFRNLFHYCVGPGITNVQPVVHWRVIDAWWNGGVGCQPGYYGPA